MNSRLPRLTTVLILLAAAAFVATRDRGGAIDARAQAATATAARLASNSPDARSAGDKLLVQAATALDRRASVSARLRHQVLLGDRQLYGVGSYWQQGSGAELRVRLELQIAGQEARLLQVSDSWFLWIDRTLPTGRHVSRTNLRELRADPVLSAASLRELEPGSATWSSVQPELVAQSGGLPSLLASLSENFSFLPPQAMRLAAQSAADSQSASIPVYAVVGHWKPEKLSALLAKGEKANGVAPPPADKNARLSMLNSLPNRLPQEVLVLVGQADLFPYRIEYRRLETPLGSGLEAAAIPYQLSANPLLVLELTDIAFDVPITAGQFDYSPGDADWSDQTAAVLERLRLLRERQLAARAGSDASLPVR